MGGPPLHALPLLPPLTPTLSPCKCMGRGGTRRDRWGNLGLIRHPHFLWLRAGRLRGDWCVGKWLRCQFRATPTPNPSPQGGGESGRSHWRSRADPSSSLFIVPGSRAAGGLVRWEMASMLNSERPPPLTPPRRGRGIWAACLAAGGNRWGQVLVTPGWPGPSDQVRGHARLDME